jgi:hypothetical protein
MALAPLIDWNAVAAGLGISTGLLLVALSALFIWNLAWKGVALWKSANKKHIVWFIVFLIINTVGILEILYIFIFSKMGRRH